MTIEMIALNLLVPSQANVRKTNGGIAIEELAASIEAHGLLQNLTVRAAPKGKFEVVAGGRRLAALVVLRRQKKLAKDFPVPCHVIGDADAGEISLAENVVRLAMHSADQFEAFKALAEQGMGIEDIAARFGVSAVVVRQRLKLASISPVLIGVYREGDMTLDQLMAFTVSDDPAAQEAAWFDSPTFRRSPASIRATLTEAAVEADDRRVCFVGLDAYLAAGGGMNRDLFQPEHEGYLTDAALLDRLVLEKLECTAVALRGEGWAWVETMPLRSFAGYGRVRSVRQPLTHEQSARLDELAAAYDELAETQGDEPDTEAAEQMETLWAEIQSIEDTAYVWDVEDKARAGAILSLDHHGGLMVERGLIRPDDNRRHQDKPVAQEGCEERVVPKPSGLSAALVESLTAERTAALRAMMMDDSHVALASLCHALAMGVFYSHARSGASCLQIKLTRRELAASADTLETSRAGAMLAERHAAWEARLPEEADALFGWLLAQESATVTDLLAYCAAQSLDAVCDKSDRADSKRIGHADAVAEALHLDMRDWWVPTMDNYLGRVSKTVALEAVREGVSPQAAENLATLKKDRLAAAAEQRLAGTGWLPVLLRCPASGEDGMDDNMREAA